VSRPRWGRCDRPSTIVRLADLSWAAQAMAKAVIATSRNSEGRLTVGSYLLDLLYKLALRLESGLSVVHTGRMKPDYAFDHRVGVWGEVTALRLTEKATGGGARGGRRFNDEDFAKTSWNCASSCGAKASAYASSGSIYCATYDPGRRRGRRRFP